MVRLGHESGRLMGGLALLQKEEETLDLPLCKQSSMAIIYKPGRGSSPEFDHADTLILDYQFLEM